MNTLDNLCRNFHVMASELGTKYPTLGQFGIRTVKIIQPLYQETKTLLQSETALTVIINLAFFACLCKVMDKGRKYVLNCSKHNDLNKHRFINWTTNGLIGASLFTFNKCVLPSVITCAPMSTVALIGIAALGIFAYSHTNNSNKIIQSLEIELRYEITLKEGHESTANSLKEILRDKITPLALVISEGKIRVQQLEEFIRLNQITAEAK